MNRLFVAIFFPFVWVTAVAGQANVPPGKPAVWTADLSEIRRVATMIPGKLPLRINVVKFAESLRSKKFSVK